MDHPASRTTVLGLLIFAVGSLLPGAAPAADTVRDDWHFRESLPAIRAWEAVLERWEKSSPPKDAAPVLPVPQDGQWVAWPHPVPLTLIPPEDRGLQVRYRFVDAKVQIERSGADGKVVRETAAPGGTVLGYKHPGGGGKDQWYHAYHRRFDRLTTFVVRPSPLALELATPLDLQRGPGAIAVKLRNTGPQPLAVGLALEIDTPERTREASRQSLSLAAGAVQSLSLPVQSEGEGGGLFVLRIEAGGEKFWIPLLTHVEDVSAVLKSIGQILDDYPEPSAAARLASLKDRAASWKPGDADDSSWRSRFEEASRLRDQLLLARLRFDTLLFAKRKPYFSEQPFMDAHHLYNRPGGGIYRLSPVRPEGKVSPVADSLGEGVYRDLALHWDARRLLFAFGNGSDRWTGDPSYHIFEIGADGAGLRQLTTGPKNDCEPFYLPEGKIGFTSDRSEHYVMCGGNRHSPTLYVMEADGSGVRQLSFNVFNDFNPCLLPDGRILYSRWEYNERSVTSLHNPFTMNPDGTMVQPYYGNATIRPNVVMFPRPVPGSPKVMALFTAHHGQTHGAVGLIDVRRGIDGDGPLELLTPGVPVTAEKALDSRCGWFSDPMPLSEDTWLCSYTPTVLPWLERTWALYVADRHGNLALVYRDPAISCAEPVPLVPRPAPHARPAAPAHTAAADAEATLFLADVYQGLTGVPRGTVRRLRVLEDLPRKSVPDGGVITTSGTLIFTIKRVFGTVPIEPDGSAHFVVPANRNVYFEVLDKDGEEIQRMRSVVCLKPGESRGCIGCHERRSLAPPASLPSPARGRGAGGEGAGSGRAAASEGAARGRGEEGSGGPLALRRPPSRPMPPPWGAETVSFLRDIQPLLNARCASCHAYDRAANDVILTDDLTDRFTVGYEELLPYLTVATSNRWDHPDDVLPRLPYTYGSKVSPLTKLLRADHYGVRLTDEEWQRLLTWIDCNGVYYDRYETRHYPDRRIFSGPVRDAVEKVFARRCANCHGADEGRHDTWWLSLNRRDPAKSRMLAAPLDRSAGGWGRCDGKVFAGTDDPDYRAMLAALSSLGDRLAKAPREDLLSIRGTPAEGQPVVLPEPPPRPPAPAEPLAKDWVYLSDLPWESARAGWTPNQDGLPRRDKTIDHQPIRIGNRKYPKGLGTHAASEIVYSLDGKFARFQAVVQPPERGGTVVFQVFGDDKPLYDSGVVRARDARTVDVPLPGVRRLRLVVTDAGDGIIHDCATWAGARVQIVAKP